MIYFVSLDAYMRINEFFVLTVDINLDTMAQVWRDADLRVQWPGIVVNILDEEIEICVIILTRFFLQSRIRFCSKRSEVFKF